jgi:hypothetical protein
VDVADGPGDFHVGTGFEGGYSAECRGGFGKVDIGSREREFAEGFVVEAGFGGAEALDLPASDDGGEDGGGFSVGAGLDAGGEVFEKAMEFGGGFTGEEDTCRVDSVGDAVAGGAKFSFGCGGALGEGPVGSGGADSRDGGGTRHFSISR